MIYKKGKIIENYKDKYIIPQSAKLVGMLIDEKKKKTYTKFSYHGKKYSSCNTPISTS